MTNIYKKGAEAELIKKEKKILKNRKQKKYRLKKLDKQIRQQRSRKEAKITQDARKAGVPTPIILDLKKTEILFEYIEGKTLKNIFGEIEPKYYRKIGEHIAKLHKNGIIHGDLTTSNLLKKKDKIYFIDFGLSDYDEKIEPKGVDLHILFQTIRSTHPENRDSIEKIKQGYIEKTKNPKKVLERLKEIEERGRYS